MLNNIVFYHGTIRKLTIAMGTMLNNIHLQRRDNTDTVVQDFVVPLSYASKQRFLAKLRKEVASQGPGVSIVLPRISYNLENFQYDSTRKKNSLGKRRTPNPLDADLIKKMYNPVPYNFNYVVNIAVKNTEDGLIILEQILPYFNPEFNVTINDIPDLNIKTDVPITLSDVSYDDTFEGALIDDFRAITWTLSFQMKGYLYPPITDSAIIKKVGIDFTDYPDGPIIEELDVEVNPLTANENDPHTVDTIITNIE
jgi:hypothetical protein